MGCEYNFWGKWISVIYRYGQIYIDKELKRFQIGGGQCVFLLVLFRNEGLSQEAISFQLHIDKGATAKAIKKLEEAGYVYRKIDDADRRAYKVYPTEKARKIEKDICQVIQSWANILAKDFTVEEKKIALKILDKMAQNAADFTQIEK